MQNYWLVIYVKDSTTAKWLVGQVIIKVYDIPLSSGMFHGYFDSSPGISS